MKTIYKEGWERPGMEGISCLKQYRKKTENYVYNHILHYVEEYPEMKSLYGNNSRCYKSICGRLLVDLNNYNYGLEDFREKLTPNICKTCARLLVKRPDILVKDNKMKLTFNTILQDKIDTLHKHELTNTRFSEDKFNKILKTIGEIANSELPNPYCLKKYNVNFKGRDYKTKGLYFLFSITTNIDEALKKGNPIKSRLNLVYVGITKNNIGNRISMHSKDKSFDRFSIIKIEDDLLMKVLESIYIYNFKPKYNKIF